MSPSASASSSPSSRLPPWLKPCSWRKPLPLPPPPKRRPRPLTALGDRTDATPGARARGPARQASRARSGANEIRIAGGLVIAAPHRTLLSPIGLTADDRPDEWVASAGKAGQGSLYPISLHRRDDPPLRRTTALARLARADRVCCVDPLRWRGGSPAPPSGRDRETSKSQRAFEHAPMLPPLDGTW